MDTAPTRCGRVVGAQDETRCRRWHVPSRGVEGPGDGVTYSLANLKKDFCEVL